MSLPRCSFVMSRRRSRRTSTIRTHVAWWSPRRPPRSRADLALEPVLWINDPQANRAPATRYCSYESAGRLGFEVPETVVTADPARIRRRSAVGRADGVQAVGGQLVGDGHHQFVIHTTRIDAAELHDDTALAASPRPPAPCARRPDVRATVSAIRSSPAALPSGRLDYPGVSAVLPQTPAMTCEQRDRGGGRWRATRCNSRRA